MENPLKVVVRGLAINMLNQFKKKIALLIIMILERMI